MLQDYPNFTFTPEKSLLSIDLKTGMKITIVKFIMLGDGQDFLSDHSLGFQVQNDNITHPVKSFVGLISPSQKDPRVVEPNMVFPFQEPCNVKIKIVNQNKQHEYSITMVYDIQPL